MLALFHRGRLKKTDAIQMSLEHQSGQGMEVFVPYKKSWFGKMRYGELFATPRLLQFFADKYKYIITFLLKSDDISNKLLL